MSNLQWLRDPSAETSAALRARVQPPASLAGKTIGLFDIGKTRTDEFFNQVELRLQQHGYATRRVGKPTNAKVATPDSVQKISEEVDVVIIGLSD